MTRKKILLAYITRYSGHHQASLAIEKALKGLEEKLKIGLEVVNIDFLRYLHPVGRIFLEKAYLRMLEKNPQTWEYLYDNPEVYSRLQKWVNRLGAWKSSKLARLMEKFDPDIICCTQAFPALMLANFKQQGSLKTPIVGVLTDYSPHRYWVHQEINLYVVPSKEVGNVLTAKGISENRIRDFGIPIDPKFLPKHLKCLNKGEVLKKLGFSGIWPIVLVMGGGCGLGPIKEVVEELEGYSFPFQLVVVCGRKKKLQKELEKLTPFLRYPARILGYTKNIDELMKISSVIITKPGGLTVSECLACELPMILVNPIPGQEVLNAQFLVKHNLAVTVPDGKEAASAAIRLLKDEQERERMRARAKDFSRPDAALVIAYNLIKGWA